MLFLLLPPSVFLGLLSIAWAQGKTDRFSSGLGDALSLTFLAAVPLVLTVLGGRVLSPAVPFRPSQHFLFMAYGFAALSGVVVALVLGGSTFFVAYGVIAGTGLAAVIHTALLALWPAWQRGRPNQTMIPPWGDFPIREVIENRLTAAGADLTNSGNRPHFFGRQRAPTGEHAGNELPQSGRQPTWDPVLACRRPGVRGRMQYYRSTHREFEHGL
jgi:hypothetical protein